MAKSLSGIIKRWPTAEAKHWVEAFTQQACTLPQILAVVAFGSAVRSTDYCADVDLLVIYDLPKPRVLRHPVEVDIRWHKKAEAERLIGEGHELLGWVLNFGELICERDGYWTMLREAHLGRMPFPSADVAAQREQRAWRVYGELTAMGDFDAAHEQLLVARTQQARTRLIRKGIYPASRPELPKQLREIGEFDLAEKLEEILREREQGR